MTKKKFFKSPDSMQPHSSFLPKFAINREKAKSIQRNTRHNRVVGGETADPS